MDIYGWKICIFTAVSFNGKFSHNSITYMTITGDTLEEVKSKIVLESPKRVVFKDGSSIETTPYIHDIEYLGKQVRRTIIEYVK